jgi:O-antigen/teichoic acid export membrane protein
VLQYRTIISSAGTLLTGSALASVISLLALPILTRIYSPEIFGVGAIYLAFHSLLVVLASGRYSMAIPLPKREETATYIFWLVVFLSTILGGIFSVSFVLFGEPLARLLSAHELAFWMPFLGMTASVAAILDTVNYWLVRQKKYRRRAFFAIIQVVILISFQLLAGLIVEPDVFVYMMALVSGMFVSMLVVVISNVGSLIKKIRWAKLKKIALCFSRLPKHLFTTALPNTVSVISVPLIISAISGPAVAAIYSVSAQLVGKPMNLISSAIWQVIYGVLGANSTGKEDDKSLLSMVYKSTTFLYSIPLLVIVAYPDLMNRFFGNDWNRTGEMMIMYIIMAYFQFSSNSISYFQIFEKYEVESVVNILLIVTRLTALFSAWIMGFDGFQTVLIFCVVSAVVYASITSYWSLNLQFNLSYARQGIVSFLLTFFYAMLLSNYIENFELKFILASLYVAIYFFITKFSITRMKPQ